MVSNNTDTDDNYGAGENYEDELDNNDGDDGKLASNINKHIYEKSNKLVNRS